MDFFSSQDDARRRTRRLVALFALSVVAIVVLMYALMLALTESGTQLWNPELLGMTAAGTLGVIFLGSGYKTLRLSAHGGEVARDLGGRQIDPDSMQPDERRLLNVVEEMALASGVPVPQVWVLDDEDGINAFASGHSPADAAIGVTRGCLRTLTRSELQGVIAHEFSHILNGDMRLNLRMIGLIHGILIIAIAGRIILRSASNTRGSSRDNRGGGGAILMAGLGLLVIGSVGVFFSKLIKSAISRQREFLADASAVQFTRHPESIGNALLKIGGSQYGSRLTSAKAEEASHMMFGNALRGGRMKWFATHPPLEDRVRAILPQWDGRWPEVALPEIASAADPNGEARDTPQPPPFPFPAPASSPASSTPGPAAILAAILTGQVSGENARTAIDRIGNATAEELAAARELHAKVPDWLRSVLRDPGGAQAAVFAVILFAESGLRDGEVAVLTELVDASTRELTLRIANHISDWHSCHLIALVDLAIPALRRLSPAEYERFSRIMTALIQSDRKVDLFEFMLQKIVRRHLDQFFHHSPPPRIRFRQWQQVEPDAAVLLRAMAAVGARDPDARTAAFDDGRRFLQANNADVTTDAADPDLRAIDAALDRFDSAAPPLKRLLLHACSTAAVHDGRLSSDEAELLRAMADTIGCPLPPFVRSATAAD